MATFLNVKRATVPTDVTLPVAAQTLGTKAADFFAGWTSPVTSVFNSGALGGAKALTEQNFDGRIAAKTNGSWRDAEVTTYAGSVYALLRLTAAGRAFSFFYTINGGGFLFIEEVSGINPALPIRQGGNGVPVRTIYDSAVGGQTMTTRFGPSGTDVVTDYSTTPAAGHTMTLGVAGFRIYVKWKNTLIVDLPYDGWTHMEAGQIALAPTAAYGVIDSSVDFRPLAVLDSVASSIPHPSDFSNSAAPTLNLHDVGLKQIRQTGCSISVGSTTLTVPSTTPWRVGDKGIVEAGQVAFTITPGGGNVGNGHFVPGCPYLSTDEVPGKLANWQTGNWVITFTSASTLDADGKVATPGQYTVTRPNSSSGGTGFAEKRYDDGITFQIMEGGTATLVQGRVTFTGRVPFAVGDTFTITCTASGETSTSTWDSKPAAGRNRTIGVGGVKPVQSVTQAQHDANNGLGYAADTLAYISDNVSGNQGKVKYRGVASWGNIDTDPYGRNARPQALKFKVVAILSSTTLQIDTPASATTANATVWFNAVPVWERVLGTDFTGYDNVTVRVPAGDYAGAADETATATVFSSSTRTGWKFKGEGIDVTNIWQPRGVDGNFVIFNHWNDSGDEGICDFSVYGNDHINGGFAKQIDITNPNLLMQIPTLVTLDVPRNTSINRVKVVNSRGQSLDVRSGFNSFIRNCVSLKTVPAIAYSGWLINMSDCSNGDNPCGLIDNVMTCSWLQGAHETFGSVNGEISGFTITNGVLSTNSSSAYNIHDGTFTFTKNSWFSEFSLTNPTINISANQQHIETFAGSISNVDFIYQGFLTETNDLNNAIVIDLSPVPGVSMTGTYDPTVAYDGNRRGLISRPDWITGNENLSVMLLVLSGSGCTLTNYRIVGDTTLADRPQVYNAGTLTANSNIVDTIGGSPAPTLSGNVTNVVYNAR